MERNGFKCTLFSHSTLFAQIKAHHWQCQLTASDRELYMKSGQGFLLVFSITSLSSLNELYELREQIVRIKNDARVPIVIVGNKSDLEDDRAVSRARAFSVSESWGHAPYYETSARRRANVDEAFVDLCRQIIRKDTATNINSKPSKREHLSDTMGVRMSSNSGGGGGGGSSRNHALRTHAPGRRRRRRDTHCNIL